MHLKQHEIVTNNIDIEIFAVLLVGHIEWGSLNTHKVYGEDGLMKISGIEYMKPVCQQAVNKCYRESRGKQRE